MPRNAEANARVRKESRARIMESALRLFAQRGYAGTSVRMIAQEAGISVGLLYNYFAGKEALLHALFEESMSDVRASFAEAQAAGTPHERIERLVHASFRILRERETFWRLSYGVRMQPGVIEGLGERLAAWTREIRSTLERLLAEAGIASPAVEAAILFAVIDGVSQHYVLEPSRYPLEEVSRRIVARFRAS